MINDQQVKKLRSDLNGGMRLAAAALRSGMSEKTARKYRNMNQLPSEAQQPHHWRMRLLFFAIVVQQQARPESKAMIVLPSEVQNPKQSVTNSSSPSRSSLFLVVLIDQLANFIDLFAGDVFVPKQMSNEVCCVAGPRALA